VRESKDETRGGGGGHALRGTSKVLGGGAPLYELLIDEDKVCRALIEPQ
jgi:hypothetical protein